MADTLANLVLESWKKQNVVIFKEDEKKVLTRLIDAVKGDYKKEQDLEVEVNKMLEQLERTNPGDFQRNKMFSLLKQKLAKEKGIVL